MKREQLIAALQRMPTDTPVILSCQGYTARQIIVSKITVRGKEAILVSDPCACDLAD
jgi:hypothetical protein